MHYMHYDVNSSVVVAYSILPNILLGREISICDNLGAFYRLLYSAVDMALIYDFWDTIDSVPVHILILV